MASRKLFIVLLLSVVLSGCSFTVSDFLSNTQEIAAEGQADIERIHTLYKFQDRLNTSAQEEEETTEKKTSLWR